MQKKVLEMCDNSCKSNFFVFFNRSKKEEITIIEVSFISVLCMSVESCRKVDMYNDRQK